ncbi:hypothetical protein ALP66_101553 [Pseudomonas amygdali pv. photiniae]|uniref:Uncharacterized protein n=10 Tax=Pseudomonas syringae group TaxID=136849 RepID=A0AAX1VLB8_PSEAJ|nr:hypothetical protein ALO79_100249 [Pseudomonas syringae pv. castaneae]KPW93417.1 hypothetical protein ALO50_101567 [Pseudomonas syringae pv. cerasicola]KPX05388.1 hypothetical protein ALO73_101424 [Pseudomonas syringae pv. daphniphylli]KPX12613.1 hypothetical protein ALO71_101331 [Pseudomonas amygdali pv. dendropanacis]KPX20206.1 hypothetical protein ALO70_101353 [Pseudomonas amygdali pv. eriobotryae]KPX58145.1 hypothetical protein ALO67_101050 [Pseudomonas amygdali pv. hibisci]KPX58682.1 
MIDCAATFNPQATGILVCTTKNAQRMLGVFLAGNLTYRQRRPEH